MGGGSSSSSSKPTKETIQAQKSQRAASTPILMEFAKQMMQALQGNYAQIPLAQRATEAGMNAAATTSANTEEALARSGVTGPYARQVQAGVDQKGAFDVSQITPQMIMALLQQVPDFALMRGSPIWGGQVQKSSSSSFSL